MVGPEFWDVINQGQGGFNQGQGGSPPGHQLDPIAGRPHVIYTSGPAPNVGTNLGGVGRPTDWYGTQGGTAHYIVNPAPAISYPQPRRPLGGSSGYHIDQIAPPAPGFVREYVL